MAFNRPHSTWTMLGPGWPSLGAEPKDLVTTPPAPASAARRSEAPVVPRMPAARMTGFGSNRPPASTVRDGMGWREEEKG